MAIQLSGRPIWERIALVVSAIPIALVANVLRVTAMGLFAGTAGTTSDALHDVSGWLMMPLALLLYWFEIWVLSRILVESKFEAPPMLDLVGTHRPAGEAPTVTKGYKPSVL